MYDFFAQFLDPQFLIMVFTAIAVFATVASISMTALSGDRLNSRMKYVSSEREKMRAERLAQLAEDNRNARLRNQPKGFMKQIVEQLNLRKLLETDSTRERLKMAGLRGQAPVIAFLFARLVLPFVAFGGTLAYLFLVQDYKLPPLPRLGISLGAAYLGFYLPNLFVTNMIQRRQKSIKGAFPDALDLMLICVQAGMSIEAAFSKVASEVGTRSLELAEELSLTTAELSYLPDRRQAFENLGKRTGLPGVKAVATSLIQAERYGTAISMALRTMAQENRDMRMAEAEKKAAALPPKLTVPMIAFFLPVLFVVILGPAYIKVMEVRGG
ncbi:MAG: type II secretion system F family protein [Hyphomicrobiaceae bacterium]|nr:type II secretion system F family protein [Hyphomicrobiaceae bacterium]